MVQQILVEPLGDGWTVGLGRLANAMVFLSGCEAERAAKRLGVQLADAGHPAEIRIFIRGGELAAHYICSPAEVRRGDGLGQTDPDRRPSLDPLARA